jgi:hypothetical protein
MRRSGFVACYTINGCADRKSAAKGFGWLKASDIEGFCGTLEQLAEKREICSAGILPAV